MIPDLPGDEFGAAILDELEPARRFSAWMYATIEPFLGTRILEIGSGIGNISRQLPVREFLTLSDYSDVYRKHLSDTFRIREHINIVGIDLTDNSTFEGLDGQYDSVVCLNVLEHIEDDQAALERMTRLLLPGGKLVILVPQYRFLMSKMDRMLGHFRRYNQKELRGKLEDAGLLVETVMNFNALGILGWYVNNILLGRSSLGTSNIRLFDAMVPVMRPLERFIPLPGLSVIGVGVKR